MSRRFGRNTAISLSVLMLGMMLAVLFAGPAGADVLRGDCTGLAEFPSKVADTTLVAERPRSDVFLVPKEETVVYSGTIKEGAEPFDSPVGFEGGVRVQTPFGGWQVVGWGGESTQVSADGAYTYSVPGWVPAGTSDLELTAWHRQGDFNCEVAVTIQLDGEPGPVALVAALGTAVLGAGVLAAGSKKGVER